MVFYQLFKVQIRDVTHLIKQLVTQYKSEKNKEEDVKH